jgi:ribosomal protein L11 methyltransferase
LAKHYPAIEIASSGDLDLILAIADDFSPTAVEERGQGVRLFFSSGAARDAACSALSSRYIVRSIEVNDEDWARRSQENLPPVTVGRITVFADQSAVSNPKSEISIVIAPSMGFGTGHHATTRLCLAALQTIDLDGKTVLDVGTGSGVLAIAADRLGAALARGIDIDADAIQSANENLTLNPEARHVTFQLADLHFLLSRGAPPPRADARAPWRAGVSRTERHSVETQHLADVIVANLTGTLLIRSASALVGAVRNGGVLIVSGMQAHEREQVCEALAPAPIVWEREEDGWVGLAVKKS